MSDPLGLISGSGGIHRPVVTPAAQVGQDAQGASFKDVLLQNINEVNKLQQQAATAIEDLSTGQRNDLEGVILATQKADSAFRMLLAVRNKVQQAYEEVKQLRV